MKEILAGEVGREGRIGSSFPLPSFLPFFPLSVAWKRVGRDGRKEGRKERRTEGSDLEERNE